MKVSVVLCLFLISPLVIAQTLMPQQTRYMASDDTRKFDSTEYTVPASFEQRIALAEMWPKINGISFDREKDFTITGTGITKINNGISIRFPDQNCYGDCNACIDGNYFIRRTGSIDENATGKKGFLDGIYIPLNKPIQLGTSFIVDKNSLPHALFIISKDKPILIASAYTQPISIISSGVTADININSQNSQACLRYDDTTFICTDATTGKIEIKSLNGVVSDNNITSAKDMITNRLCFPDTTCMTTSSTGLPADFNEQYITRNTTQSVSASKYWNAKQNFNDDINLQSTNIQCNGSTGCQIATNNTQKLGFYGTSPTVQISGGTDVLAGLVTQGLRAASSNPPMNLGSGRLTCGDISASGTIDIVTLTVRGESTFNGTVTYMKSALISCKADYNAGILKQIRGAGCP